MATQKVAPTLTGFQSIKPCIQYMAGHPHKPIFYPYNYYDLSILIRLKWSGNQVEDYTYQNCLKCNQCEDLAIILNIIWSVSGIIYTLLGVDV